MPPRSSAREPEPAASVTRPPANVSPRRGTADRVDAVRLLDRIGAGGTAEVWRARMARGAVALKVLRPGAGVPVGHAALLEHEHAVLAAVRRPNIVATYGLVDSPLGTALALEYVPGGDLVSLSGSHPRTWIGAAAQIAAAVAHVHACGYAYRDLKARNVLFDTAGRPRLIDFAAALPLGAQQPSGGTTAAYRPAVEPGRVGVYEDEVAFAVLLYELFTGRLPFGPDGRTRGAVVPPALPAGIAPHEPLAALAELVAAVLAGAAGAGSLSELAAVIDTVAAGFR